MKWNELPLPQKIWYIWTKKGAGRFALLPGGRKEEARAQMRDPLRAIKRQLENSFESQRWQSSEKNEKLLAAGAAVLAIVVIGGALFFKKGGKVSSLYDGLVASGTTIATMRDELSALQTRATALQKEADVGKSSAAEVLKIRAELEEVKHSLVIESAELQNKTLLVANHATETARQEDAARLLREQVETATRGQSAAQLASTEMAALLTEKENEIRGLNEEVAQKKAAEAKSEASLAEVSRLTVANTRLVAQTQNANRERTNAATQLDKVRAELMVAIGKLQVAEERAARLGEVTVGLGELSVALESANDALDVAEAQMKLLRARNEQLSGSASEADNAKAALRAAQNANALLEERLSNVSAKNKEMYRAAEKAETELVSLRAVKAQVEAMSENMDTFAKAASKAIKQTAKAELQNQANSDRADIAEQAGSFVQSVLGKLATVVAAQEHTAIEKLQEHLSLISQFDGAYKTVLGQLNDMKIELGNAQADAAGSKGYVVSLKAQLSSTSELVEQHSNALLAESATRNKMVGKATAKGLATGKQLALETQKRVELAIETGSRQSEQLTVTYNNQLKDVRAHYDAHIASLKADLATSAVARDKLDEIRVTLTGEKATALGRAKELEATVERLTSEIKAVRLENTELILDLSISDAEALHLNAENQKVIQTSVALKGDLQLEVANTRATVGNEMKRLDIVINSFLAILAALSAFTDGVKGLAGSPATSTNIDATLLFVEFRRAFNAAVLVLPSVGMGSQSIGALSQIIGESAEFTARTVWSLAVANEVATTAISARDSADAVAKLAEASLAAEKGAHGVSRGERDSADEAAKLADASLAAERWAHGVSLGERDLARDEMRRGTDERVALVRARHDMERERDAAIAAPAKGEEALRGAILDLFDPSQIVHMVPVAELPRPIERDTTINKEIAADAVAALRLPTLISLYKTLMDRRVTTSQEHIDHKVRSVCVATGLALKPMPRSLTADGLVELRAWLLEFESSVGGRVSAIGSSLPPDVVSAERSSKRGRVDSALLQTKVPERPVAMVVEFGSIQLSRNVTQLDFLGAFLSVQRMLITCAGIEAGLVGIEATAAMTPARFGMRMRRAYV